MKIPENAHDSDFSRCSGSHFSVTTDLISPIWVSVQNFELVQENISGKLLILFVALESRKS